MKVLHSVYWPAATYFTGEDIHLSLTETTEGDTSECRSQGMEKAFGGLLQFHFICGVHA